MSIIDLLIVVGSAVLVFFLPGYIWSFVFFPDGESLQSEDRSIDFIERVALSIALSIALITLVVFIINAALDFPVDILTSLASVALACSIGLVLLMRFEPAVLRSWMKSLKGIYHRLSRGFG